MMINDYSSVSYNVTTDLPLLKMSPLKCLWMMTSCEKAVFRKIVDSSITNIFIPLLIISDDLMEILLLAYKV